MDKIQSHEVLVNKEPKELFNLLSDLRNLKKIIPDSINASNITQSTCSLKISGLAEISLKISEKKPFSRISLLSDKSPIPFTLNCNIVDKNNKSLAVLSINTKLNFMTKIMVEKPLKKLLNSLAENLQNL